ncbi:hypothetical protein [uncultured Methanobrevibacter sp.]|uniref:hypothetical protein n=1 Tax=uncultured Methanobrevibacter sp. TaxID=253161 RepID=UPI0025E687DC|nr:hypothetical protein [uncultured Methanobrevibacter sp.]
MKKIAIILIIGLLAISAIYAEQTTKTYHVTDKKILSGGYEQNYEYVIETQEDGDIIINAKDYTKIHINDVITVELSDISFVRKLISINGQNVQ